MTYDRLFDRFGQLDANVLLPVENDDQANRVAAEALALRTRSAAVAGLLMLLAVIDLARVHRVDDSRVTASRDHLRVALSQPLPAVTIELGRGGETWFGPPAHARFRIDMLGRDGHRGVTRAADQVVTAACRSGVRAIDIAGDDLRVRAAERLRVLATSSLLRRLLGTGAC